MTNNLIEMSVDENSFPCPHAWIDLPQMRVRVSKFEYVVRTHHLDFNTLL